MTPALSSFPACSSPHSSTCSPRQSGAGANAGLAPGVWRVPLRRARRRGRAGDAGTVTGRLGVENTSKNSHLATCGGYTPTGCSTANGFPRWLSSGRATGPAVVRATASGTVISRRVGSGPEVRDAPWYPSATLASAMSTSTAPVVGRAIVPQPGGLEVEAQRAYRPAAAAVRPGVPVSPARAGRPQSAICFFVKACSYLFSPNQPSRRRSRAIPAGGVCGTEVAFSLAQSGLFRSLERFCRRPVGLWGLGGPVAIRRRPPFAGVVRAVGPHPPGTPRSGVQQKCPPTSGSISARPPAEGRHPTTGSGRSVVLRRPALPTVMAHDGVSGTSPVASGPQRQLYGRVPTTVPAVARELGAPGWPAPPAAYLPSANRPNFPTYAHAQPPGLRAGVINSGPYVGSGTGQKRRVSAGDGQPWCEFGHGRKAGHHRKGGDYWKGGDRRRGRPGGSPSRRVSKCRRLNVGRLAGNPLRLEPWRSVDQFLRATRRLGMVR